MVTFLPDGWFCGRSIRAYLSNSSIDPIGPIALCCGRSIPQQEQNKCKSQLMFLAQVRPKGESFVQGCRNEAPFNRAA
jgi:hypothetical protein